MIDADKTLRDFTDVLNGWADHRPLQKAGASAHAKAMAQHHGELAGRIPRKQPSPKGSAT